VTQQPHQYSNTMKTQFLRTVLFAGTTCLLAPLAATAAASYAATHEAKTDYGSRTIAATTRLCISRALAALHAGRTLPEVRGFAKLCGGSF
jgi:hypothetical protein